MENVEGKEYGLNTLELIRGVKDKNTDRRARAELPVCMRPAR